jgi:hypothetical protein
LPRHGEWLRDESEPRMSVEDWARASLGRPAATPAPMPSISMDPRENGDCAGHDSISVAPALRILRPYAAALRGIGTEARG